MALLIRETFVNDTKNYRFGESHWFRSHTDDLSTLYRSLRKEFGGKVSKMYYDELQVTGLMAAVPHGWVFTKRMKYEGSDKSYTRSVWVEVKQVSEDEANLLMA